MTFSTTQISGFMLFSARCTAFSDASWVMKIRVALPSGAAPFCIIVEMEIPSPPSSPVTSASTPGASLAFIRMKYLLCQSSATGSGSSRR